MSRFQLYLIADEAEEREHIYEIMHQEIINDSRKKPDNESDVYLSLKLVIIDDYNYLFMMNVNVAKALSIILFNAHQLLFIWKKTDDHINEHSQ